MDTIANPPIGDSVVETDERSRTRKEPFYMAKSWIVWLFESLVPRVQVASQWLTKVTLTAQSASIIATAIPLPALAAGEYRISLYGRITTPDSLGSSLTVTAGWTEGAVAIPKSSPAATGNSTSTTALLSELVTIDRATSLTYATTWAATTGDGRYKLIVTIEQVN